MKAFFILVLILACLFKQVWGFSEDPDCQTCVLVITGRHVEAQGIGLNIVLSADIYLQCNGRISGFCG